MGVKVTNNAFGTLNAGINSSATTIVLESGQGARFPTLSAGDYFYATLIDTSNNLEMLTARTTGLSYAQRRLFLQNLQTVRLLVKQSQWQSFSEDKSWQPQISST